MRAYSENDPGNHLEAEVRDLVRTLRHYDCLTRERLAELSGARHWHEHYFEAALSQAVKRGLIKRLNDDLVELADSERASTTPGPQA